MRVRGVVLVLCVAVATARAVPATAQVTADFEWRPEIPAPGEAVQFEDRSAGDPEYWAWSFGDGGVAEGPTPVHTYQAPGEYQVDLVVTAGASTDTATRVIQVSEPLQAAFAWAPAAPAVGQQVAFTDLSVGDPTAWEWDFGDGSGSTEPSPVHVYQAADIYRVRLRVWSGSGDESRAEEHIQVRAGLSADFDWRPESPSVGDLVEFFDHSQGGPRGWSWDFGDGSSGHGPHPLHVYNEPGLFPVTLTVTGTEGEPPASLTREIAVAEDLVLDFTWSPHRPAAGRPVELINLTRGEPGGWHWDFGDGQHSQERDPVHVFELPGTYDVTLASGGGKSTTADPVTKQVVVGAPLTAEFGFQPEWPVVGEEVHFQDLSGGSPEAWFWHFGDGGVAEDPDPVHVYSEPGHYNVVLTVTDSAGVVGVVEHPITVDRGEYQVRVTVSNPRPQIGEEVAFSVDGVSNAEAVLWNFGGVGCGGRQEVLDCGGGDGCLNTTYSYATPGNKTVVVIATVGGEPLEPYWLGVNVRPHGGCGEAPVAGFEWWPPAPHVGEPVRFVDLSPGPPTSWSWDFGDGAATDDQHPEHVYQEPGSYTVRLEVANDYGTAAEHTAVVEVGGEWASCGDGVCEPPETFWSCRADCAPPEGATARPGSAEAKSYVPAAVGGSSGLGETFWLTEGMLYNSGTEATSVVLEFRPDEPESPDLTYVAGPIEIHPEKAVYFENLVVDLFGTEVNGSLWIDADGPLMMDTRTYNQTTGGTYGQGISAIARSLVLAEGDGTVYLVGVNENDAFRTNLILQEVSGTPAEAEVRVYQRTGEQVASATVNVGGRQKVLKRLRRLGVSDLEGGYATVTTHGSGSLAVIASMVDQETGDGTTIDAVHPNQVLSPAKMAGDGKLAAEEAHFLVAVVARTTGDEATTWRSSVSIENPDDEDQDIRLVYFPSGGAPETASAVLEPGELFHTDDVLAELFPDTGTSSGALHVYASKGVVVGSRTYNELDDGSTLGQAIPGLGSGDMAAPGEVWVLNKLKSTSDFRCNVGFSEFSGEDSEVTITLFDVGGNSRRFLASEQYDVTAFEHFQVARIFEKLGLDEDYTEALAYVAVTSGTGAVYIYASIVDNAKGDATTVLAKRRTETSE